MMPGGILGHGIVNLSWHSSPGRNLVPPERRRGVGMRCRQARWRTGIAEIRFGVRQVDNAF
jgi:hypothetical protein